ncbi:hypothetical protein [Candidatus Sororendozoicomonas aggregata]|uniref:hypothetical protein n=1 Tax=Candidatus Sororendozoicomonas aggregata TaxID=3073239 RepID=UPI002ED692CD
MLFTQLGNVYRHQRDTCKSDSAIIANTHVSPGGKVTTSTTHTMVISPDLATVVTRFPDATVTKQKHPGATVTTVLPERATVSERQGLHPTTDLPPAAINDMTQGQLTDPLEGDLSDLPNINPTTSILFDAGDIGGIDGIDGIDDIDDIDDIDFGLDYNLPGILEFSD